VVEASFAHYFRQPKVVDLAITSVNPALKYSNGVGPFETAAECHPSSPSFVLCYAIDVNANGDDDEADDAVKRLLIGPF
jgi:hypothetical protein